MRTEVLLTQLVFEHSLRIRLKAEAAIDATPSPEADAKLLRTEGETNIVTADTASSSTFGNVSDVASASGSAREGSEGSTVIPSREPSKEGSDTTLKGSTHPNVKEAEEKDSKKSDGNLIGKINNLVTTDLNNITYGRDFLLLSAPHIFSPTFVIFRLNINIDQLFMFRFKSLFASRSFIEPWVGVPLSDSLSCWCFFRSPDMSVRSFNRLKKRR